MNLSNVSAIFVLQPRPAIKKPPAFQSLRNNPLTFLIVLLIGSLVIFIFTTVLAVRYSRKKTSRIERKNAIRGKNPERKDDGGGDEAAAVSSALLDPNLEKTSADIGPIDEISISDLNVNEISLDVPRRSTISTINKSINDKDDISYVDFSSIPLRSINSTDAKPNDQSPPSTTEQSSPNSPADLYIDELRNRETIVRVPLSRDSIVSVISEESCF